MKKKKKFILTGILMLVVSFTIAMISSDFSITSMRKSGSFNIIKINDSLYRDTDSEYLHKLVFQIPEDTKYDVEISVQPELKFTSKDGIELNNKNLKGFVKVQSEDLEGVNGDDKVNISDLSSTSPKLKFNRLMSKGETAEITLIVNLNGNTAELRGARLDSTPKVEGVVSRAYR